MKENGNQPASTGESAKERATEQKSHIKWVLLSGLVILAGVAWQAGWLDRLSLSELIRNHEILHNSVMDNYALSALAFIGLYILLVSISFPGASFMTIAGGLLFGGVLGTLYSAIGATLGATVIFLLTRSVFGGFLQQKAGPFMTRLMKGFQEDAFNYLLFLRLAPIFPFWVINIVPALMNMSLGAYFVATLLGILPGGFAYSLIGASIADIIVAQETAHPGCASSGSCAIDTNVLVTPTLVLAMAALAFVSVLPVIIKKVRQFRNAR